GEKDAMRGVVDLKTASGMLRDKTKALAGKEAADYIELSKEIPKLQDIIGNLDYAKKLSDDLGLGGMLLSSLGFSEKGKELENLSFSSIEPILKMLAPSGAIAKEKLLTAQNK